jgi:hypothetical protein
MKKEGDTTVLMPKELIWNIHQKNPELALAPIISKILGQMIENNVVRGIPHLVFQPYSKKLKSKIAGDNNLYKYWGILVEIGVIQERTTKSGKKYSTYGNKCKYLRLNPEYLSSDIIEKSFKKSAGLIKPKLIEGFLCEYVALNLSKLSFRHLSAVEENRLAAKLGTKFIKKHFRGAAPKVEVRYNKKWREYDTKLFNWEKYLEFEKISRRTLYRLKRREIESGKFYAVRNSTNRRLNHNLTNCDKLIIEKLLLNEEPIIEFDLANSQPTLFSLVLKEDIFNELINIFNQTKNMLDNPLLCSEIDTFQQLCGKGQLYKHFRDRLFEMTTDESLEEMKITFIAALYGSNDPRSKATEMFSSVFPYINTYLKEFKVFIRHFFDEAPEHEDHPLFGYLCSKEKGRKNAEDAAKDYLSIFLQRLVCIPECLTP